MRMRMRNPMCHLSKKNEQNSTSGAKGF